MENNKEGLGILTFNKYEETVVQTNLYHDAISKFVESLDIPDMLNRKRLHKLLSTMYVALGMAGEVGEIMEKLKKIVRDKNCEISIEDQHNLKREDSDVLWYVAALGKELGGGLEEVGHINIEKLLSRKERGVLGGSGDNR